MRATTPRPVTHGSHPGAGLRVRISTCAYDDSRCRRCISGGHKPRGSSRSEELKSALHMRSRHLPFPKGRKGKWPVRLMHFRGNAQKCFKMVEKYTFLAPNGVYWSVKWFKWVSNANMYTCSKLVAVFCEIVTSFAYFSMIFVGKREDFGVSRPAAMEK